ncbi:EF hand domain-containing protein [Ditylenchus destructor]|uniref:EF hand domain-containing protein n=1 Tax=Ditylenchus destructor TaxID=166010 RepID=A0AAD4RDU2_9BILA|nr:EF hand domain-containing protein [Ditylenchus destructor]
MGNSASALPTETLERLSIESGLSKSSIKMLQNRFLMLAKHRDNELNEPFMSQQDFEDIPELTKNPLGSRLIEAFFADAEAVDRKRVYFADFVRVLSHFRPINKNNPHPWNSREAKLRFAFTMYDLNKSGTITKDEFTEILEKMIGANVSKEKVESIAERTMREADKDADGSITFQEFYKAMEKTGNHITFSSPY